jgi:hypothetical protein
MSSFFLAEILATRRDPGFLEYSVETAPARSKNKEVREKKGFYRPIKLRISPRKAGVSETIRPNVLAMALKQD